MNSDHPLAEFEGAIKTDGACFPGSHVVFRGQDLHKSDLMEMDYIGLTVFGLTGIKLTNAQQAVLNHIFTITSYPDARLWNNRIAALGGTTRTTGALAIGAAIACSEAIIFGRQPMVHAADFLVRARTALTDGESLEEIVKKEIKLHKHLGGYGRPVATLQADERISILMQKMNDAGIDPFNPHNDTTPNRPPSYFALALEIESVLQKLGYKLTINYAGVMPAPALDLGFTPQQCGMYLISCFQAGMYPCYQEALNRPAGATFPLRCEKINYTGPRPLKWSNE